MTDYFALLDQPRRPWLDPEKVKASFHDRSRESHPDAHSQTAGPASSGDFAQLNEACQVLLDPKRRLQHFLALTGNAPRRLEAAPEEVESLFPRVATLTQQADALLEQQNAATNALGRSLLKPQLVALATRLASMREEIDDSLGAAEAELAQIDENWQSNPADLHHLHQLYLRFAYLTRWRDELQERQLRLE